MHHGDLFHRLYAEIRELDHLPLIRQHERDILNARTISFILGLPVDVHLRI